MVVVALVILVVHWAIGLMSRVFANGPGDRGLIPGRVIPKTQKMVLDAALLSTQHYKVRIKCSGAILDMELRPFMHLGVVAIERELSGDPRLRSPTLLTFTEYWWWFN